MSNPNTQETPTERSFVIAIANQKGGVAKTTSVVSLGGALADHEKEVLLVDLDAQANLTLALGKDPSRLRGAVTDVLFDSANLLSVSRGTDIPGLDLVPSNGGLELAERFLPMRKNYETILKRALAGGLDRKSSAHIPDVQAIPDDLGNIDDQAVNTSIFPSRIPILSSYDFILLDCPPFMGAVTMNALNAADMLIIPTQPEYFSAHSLRTMMTTIRQVRNQHNPKLIYRVLITIFDMRNRIHRDVKEQIENTFSEGIFKTTIGIDTKLRESAVEGLPITHYKSRSRSALQYDALAQELIEYVQQNKSA
jgi:chromosome partitioning protein